MNEAQTRLDLIDPALREAGWGVVEGSRILVEQSAKERRPYVEASVANKITDGRIVGRGRRNQPLKADYILFYRNKRLAVIEAKARDLGYTEGVGQAKDYAERLNIRYTYSTNGRMIYGIDMELGVCLLYTSDAADD